MICSIQFGVPFFLLHALARLLYEYSEDEMGKQAELPPRDARLYVQSFTVSISEKNEDVPHLGALERESLNVTETFATCKTTLANDLQGAHTTQGIR